MAKVKTRVRINYRSNFSNFQYRLDQKQKRVLERTGAYVRVIVQNSMPNQASPKSRKKKIAGRPPRAHKGKGGGLRWVLWSLQRNNQSVIIGPGRTHAKNSWIRGDRVFSVKSKKPVPQLLNESGSAEITVTYLKSRIVYRFLTNYSRYPISDHDPTREKALRFFREAIRTAKL
jgi:hypothetical protein